MKEYRLSRLAAVCLLAVIVAMASFSFWQSARSDDRIERIQKDQLIGAAYKEAHVQMVEIDAHFKQWVQTLDPAQLTQADIHGEALGRALLIIADTGDAADKEFANLILEYGAKFVEISAEFKASPSGLNEEQLVALGILFDGWLAEMQNRGWITAEAIAASEEVNPLPAVLGARAAVKQENVQRLVAAVDKQIHRDIYVSAVFYVSGVVLVVGLIGGTYIFGRREARARAEIDLLRRVATTDPLTGLGNRRGFEEQLRLHLGEEAEGQTVALAIMDLDEFKTANDTFGHDRGDRILRTFANILTTAAPGVQAFRIGGDEFALILPGYEDYEAEGLAERIRASADEALGTGVTVSCGVAAGVAGDETLLPQQADAALYEAKLRGRNLVVLYHDDGFSAPVFPAARLAAVRQLLVEGRIAAVFQPMWNLHTGELLAYEGLSRPSSEYGLSGPEEAFDIAERFGRAADLDRMCRQHILESASQLRESADIFINLSPYTLTHHTFDPGALREEVEGARIDPSRVVFEITERSQVSPDAIAEGVVGLHACGFRVALDDVGAGNNGLEMLRKVRFEFVKIDRNVIIAGQRTGTGRAALMAILAFAFEAKALVMAEGVEDEAMFDLVREVAQTSMRGVPGLIHGVQGYLLGRPAPADLIADEPPDLLAA